MKRNLFISTRGWTRLRYKYPPTTTRYQQEDILHIIVIILIPVTLPFLVVEHLELGLVGTLLFLVVEVLEEDLVGTSTTSLLSIVSMNLREAMMFQNLLRAHLDIVRRPEMVLLCLVTIVGTPQMAVAGFLEGKLNIIVQNARLIFA